MAQKESALFTVTPGSLSGLAVIFLLLAAFFALLNGHKVKALRADAATPRAPVPAKVNAPTVEPLELNKRIKPLTRQIEPQKPKQRSPKRRKKKQISKAN